MNTEESFKFALANPLFLKMKFLLSLGIFLLLDATAQAQQPIDSVFRDTLNLDSTLRIINLNPYFTLHVDSTLNYKLEINKEEDRFFWYLKNSLSGLKLNKDNGLLTFKAEK